MVRRSYGKRVVVSERCVFRPIRLCEECSQNLIKWFETFIIKFLSIWYRNSSSEREARHENDVSPETRLPVDYYYDDMTLMEWESFRTLVGTRMTTYVYLLYFVKWFFVRRYCK